MGVRVKSKSTNTGTGENKSFPDQTLEQRTTTVDGYTFHWGPNEVRNFLDQGVGAAHGAFKGGATQVQEDTAPFGSSRF